MTWIIPKQLHTLVCALDTEALISDSEESSQICGQSLFVRSKPMPSRTWSRKWKRDSWTRHLSGRILRPSLGQRFAIAWTSSLVDTRVSRSHVPDCAGGGGDPRHLWPYIANGIDAMRPSLCFFENVEGHITIGLRDVLNDLGELGYRATWGIFSAAEVGAPHQRKRVFVLAHSCGERGKRSERFFRDAGAIGQRRQDSQAHSHIDRWPSLSGEPRHDWEPTQTVEPSLGRGSHGSSNSLGEQLRLLGNGVVPATAALAFKILMEELSI